MKIAKNMEAIFVTVAFFGVTMAWIAPTDEYTYVQVSANVATAAPATHAAA